MNTIRGKLLRMRTAGVRQSARVIAGRLRRKLAAQVWRADPGRAEHLARKYEQVVGNGQAAGLHTLGALLNEALRRHPVDSPDETAALCTRLYPEAAAAAVECAGRIRGGSLSFLGREHRFEDTPDWFWCPESGGSWPVKPAAQYGREFYTEEDRPGDIKYPWELNRLQYFSALARAALYTGRDEYVETLVRHLEGWARRNPPGMGINWCSEMEAGVRIIAWCLVLPMLARSQTFRERGWPVMMRCLYEHAAYLEANLTEDWLMPNNHLIGEAAGLFTFAALFPQFPESRAWRRRAAHILGREAQNQIYPDGVNKEQATGYHQFVLDFLGWALLVAESSGAHLPPIVRRRIEAMVGYQAAVLPPDCRVPLVGDCDDGRGLWLSEAVDLYDFRGWIGAGAVLFDNPQWRALAGDGNEEALWLLGARRWRQFEAMARDDSPRPSRLFRDGGHAVLRTSGAPAAQTYVFLRCGDFGLGGEGGSAHSHADLLAPIVYWSGIPLLVDSGTYCYLCDQAKRDRLRTAAAHNTMTPRGCDQGDMAPYWSWLRVPRCRVLDWRVELEQAILRAEYISPQGFAHRRAFLLAGGPQRISIHDRLTLHGASASEADALFHFAPGLELRQMDTGIAAVFRNGKPWLQMLFKGFDASSVVSSAISDRYGVMRPNAQLRLTTRRFPAETAVEFTASPIRNE